MKTNILICVLTILSSNLLMAQTGSLTDIDGIVYKTIQFGTQTWMGENLKTTKFNDGTPIPLVQDDIEWGKLTTPGYCWPKISNISPSGTIQVINYTGPLNALYNWFTVNTENNGGKNVCPTGWHVPSDADWTILEQYLVANGFNYDSTTTVNKIAKSLAATTNWKSTDKIGAAGNTDYPDYRNKTGFNAFPEGLRVVYNDIAHFSDIGSNCHWWSSTKYTSEKAITRVILFTDTYLRSSTQYIERGCSVRCVKD